MEVVNRLWGLFQPAEEPVRHQEHVPATVLEERQQLLAHHVRLVSRKMSHGLFVYGSRGGLGKSRVILQTLAEEGVRPIVLTGHVTPLSLYTNLYYAQDKVLFLDDCDSLYRNLAALGILRSALWGESADKRLVTYNSSQLKIPQSFYFHGQMIFTGNNLPRRNHAFDAVLSRVDQFELDASNEEVVEMMRHLANDGFEGISPEQCHQVVDFIAEFAATRELSLRLLEPSYRKVIYARNEGVDWKDLVRSQLEQIGKDDHVAKAIDSRAYDLVCLEQVMTDHPESVAQQVDSWTQLTGKSRATFFRLKKTYEQAEQQVVNDVENAEEAV